MRILITGSRGFLGGSVGRFAAANNHEVLGLGRSSQPEVDWPGDYIQADVANVDRSKIIRDFVPDVILHFMVYQKKNKDSRQNVCHLSSF